MAAGKGGAGYAIISGFDSEDHQDNLYYFFESSSRRKDILNEYVNFISLECKCNIQHVTAT